MAVETIAQILSSLLQSNENEIIEFKEAKNDFDFTKLGRYFSALSNEANLKEKNNAWLIFGVNDKKEIVGTHYRSTQKSLDSLKEELSKKTINNITFIEIHEIIYQGERVLLFEIPATPKGIPMSFDGHYYGRNGESLSPLNIEEIERIRKQISIIEDWTAMIVPDATLKDLDEEALKIAREKFKEKHTRASFYTQIDQWSDEQFLDKAKLTIEGKLTRATLLLLGNELSQHKLSPHPAQITWKLDTEEKTYEHFNPPFLLNTTAVYKQIRNIKQKLFPKNQLLATEVMKYDSRVILEALHNCLAHQDYTQNARIIVTEKIDKLIFDNAGGFFEGSAEDYFTGEKTPKRYRNPWLAHAMVELGMIDTMGYGIHTMAIEQKNRYFPLPDYSKSTFNNVVLEIFGHTIDENYSLLLLEKKDLDIPTVIALDRVQKHLAIADDIAQKLRKANLIEGRKPNYIISSSIAEVTDLKAEYIKNKGLDDIHYKSLIIDYLTKFKKARKKDIANLLLDKLSDVLDEKQKQNKIRNILYAMSKKDQSIELMGSSQTGFWVLKEK